jgi:hypothetical protein
MKMHFLFSWLLLFAVQGASAQFSAATGVADPDAAPPTRRAREVLDVAVRLERCRLGAEGFEQRSAPLRAAWTRRHAAVLAAYDRQIAQRVRTARREQALPPELCDDDWLRAIEPLSRMPDARFATVEKTWQAFMGALMTGDRAAAVSCLQGRAATQWQRRVEAMSNEDLRRIAASIRALKVQWGDDYEKEGLVADTSNRAVGIAFRNINEEWKIVAWGAAATPAFIAP